MKEHKTQKTRKGSTARGFVLGLLVAVMLLTAVPALADGGMQDIKAWVGGITIYLDKQLKVPLDAQGNVVEPMIYEGTTYVPLRAVANMLGLEVGWDQATRSVYLGEQPNAGEHGVLAQDLTRWSGYSVKDSGSFKILGDSVSYFSALIRSIGVYERANGANVDDFITWKLDSDYKCIDGKFTLAYDSLGDDGQATLSFYNVDQYGAETQLGSFSVKCGDGPVNVHVDVTACNFVRAKLSVSDRDFNSAVFYDITATTIG